MRLGLVFLAAAPAFAQAPDVDVKDLQERLVKLEKEVAELRSPPAVTEGELRRQLRELATTLDRSRHKGKWTTLTALGLGLLAAGYLAYAKGSAERTARMEIELRLLEASNKKRTLSEQTARDALALVLKVSEPAQGLSAADLLARLHALVERTLEQEKGRPQDGQG